MSEMILIPNTNQCIFSFLEGRMETLFEHFRELSHFQINFFTPMVPSLLRDLWREGLDRDDYYLKLCGAGGGGLFIGDNKRFSKNSQGFNTL